MCEAYKLGMTAREGYVWFLPMWLNSTFYDTNYYNEHHNENVNCTTAEMIKVSYILHLERNSSVLTIMYYL